MLSPKKVNFQTKIISDNYQKENSIFQNKNSCYLPEKIISYTTAIKLIAALRLSIFHVMCIFAAYTSYKIMIYISH